MKDIDFDGFTKEPFPVGGPLPLHSTLMCRICKEPPKCIGPCHAKIFYVHGNDTIQCTIPDLHTSNVLARVTRCNARGHHKKRVDILVTQTIFGDFGRMKTVPTWRHVEDT